jgi:hypothetical protein
MATTLGTIRTRVRTFIREGSASFWTDAELLEHLDAGVRDLWGSVTQLNLEHFFTVDATNVSMAASTATLTGVPADVLRVHLIEPRDTTSTGNGRFTHFIPRDYNHPDSIAARSISAQDATTGAEYLFRCLGGGWAGWGSNDSCRSTTHSGSESPLRLHSDAWRIDCQ